MNFYKNILLVLFVINVCVQASYSQITSTFKSEDYISFSDVDNGFAIINSEKVAPILISSDDYEGVKKVANFLKQDLESVSAKQSVLYVDEVENEDFAIIVGTLGKSSLITKLISDGKINVSDVENRWEVSLIQTVDNPIEGVKKALVIVGSDKRGTIFGMFDLSAQIGVSPWYWWADVPVEKQSAVYVKDGRYNLGEPKVQYRGIFLNDEEPALGGWVRETFGGFNAQFYEKVYELILRMKGNFLWPAMWGKAHADDDPQNPILANEYGIVINYSHHEPMMRSHVEWSRYGKGAWDYTKNKETLDNFWREGISRDLGNESIVTIGMRGDGDEAMSDDRNIDLLSEIIQNQRRIIEEVTEKPAEETPQIWALYKEVQDYYDMGMRVPDDIMLLYCDDNWGNVRRTPGKEELQRKGGSGLYYHFDYVGGPRNYKWINTNPLPKIWEQNKLAYAKGVDKLWVVNVGDLKPMEFPIQFYLDLAWDPDRFSANDIEAYSVAWAKQQFGKEYANEIAQYMSLYGKYNGRRKPELLDQNTYSLRNYREWENVANDYNALTNRAKDIYNKIPTEYKDAYYQLVMYPIEATANLYNLYHSTAKNHLYFQQQRAATNLMADSVKYYYEKDSLMTLYFHTDLANGKWNHMMAQTRIGYTYWQQPDYNVIPQIHTLVVKNVSLPQIILEGQENVVSKVNNSLPTFSPFNSDSYFIEIFNQGNKPFNFKISSKDKWIVVSENKGVVNSEKRIFVSVDWSKVPENSAQGKLVVNANGVKNEIVVPLWNPSQTEKDGIKGFVGNNGFISIESSSFSRINNNKDAFWSVIPDIGRTRDGLVSQPYNAENQKVETAPTVEYDFYINEDAKINVHTYFSPTLNFTGKEGLQFFLQIDEFEPIIVNAHNDDSEKHWENIVSNHIAEFITEHNTLKSGNHTLKIGMISSGLVLQKIIINSGGLKPSYLGPKESAFVK